MITVTLQSHFLVLKQHGLASQVRELEAETDCFFISDLFLVDNERAADYTKVWIENFKSLRSPCAGMRNGGQTKVTDDSRVPFGRKARIF